MSRLLVLVTAVALVWLTGVSTASAAPAVGVGVVPRDMSLPGPYEVASTAQIVPCTGPGAAAQNADARRQGARTPLKCTTTSPVLGGPERTVDFWYRQPLPARDLSWCSSRQRSQPRLLLHAGAPLGGFRLRGRHREHPTRSAPQSPFFGVRGALAATRDPRSPVFGRVDPRGVILAGHSAGATKAIEAVGLVGAARRGLPVPADLRLPSGTSVRAVLALQPDVYTLTAAVDAPTFTVTGDADQTSRPGPIGTIVQARIDGPAWLAVARGAPHLVTVDPVDTIPFTRATVAFLLATTGDTEGCRAFVGPAWTLRTDPAFIRAVRNRAAAATSCPWVAVMTRVLVMTSPARGLLYTIVETALTLRARGHDVHIVTIADEVPLLRELGLGASPLPADLEQAAPGDHHEKGARTVRALTDRLVARADAEFAHLAALIGAHRPGLVMADVSATGAHLAAEASGLPWAVWSPTFLPLRTDGPPPGLGLRVRDGRIWRARDTALGAIARGVWDGPSSVRSTTCAPNTGCLRWPGPRTSSDPPRSC